ncbi:MAG: Fic family protein [Nitriliruptor sp.]|uniref:Fic family protein n=1 Tax=Nitriliruptor sp. TaxID=2448056 RepID=UPI0034A06CC0
MDDATFVERTFGRIERVPGPYGYDHYVPAPLPRTLQLDARTTRALSEADRAIGRLAGTGRLLPNPHLLVQPYLLTEALASSRIEGTQASLTDVLEAAVDDEESPDIDVREVQNYIAAFETARRRLGELPLSLRLIREAHERLLRNVRGKEKHPGDFRITQNWIGAPGGTLEDATFVPPRHEPEMQAALRDWEALLHERDLDLPPLVVCGLLHYQFETIHPFLDGNGRLGRLLIILYLMDVGELPEPLLYLSPYFERDRPTYYARLQAVRERGEMQAWLQYFLVGVATQAKDAVDRAERLLDLQTEWRTRLAGDRSYAPHVIDLLFATPFITTQRVMRALSVTNAGANSVLRRLEKVGILERAHVGGRGGRITWVAPAILDLLVDP